jgi:hypothetical protein
MCVRVGCVLLLSESPSDVSPPTRCIVDTEAHICARADVQDGNYVAPVPAAEEEPERQQVRKKEALRAGAKLSLSTRGNGGGSKGNAMRLNMGSRKNAQS